MQGKKKNKVRVATDRWSRYVRQKKEGISWGQICLGMSGYIWVSCSGVRVYGYISDSSRSVWAWRKNKKEWFHPGSIRGPSPRQDDVITNYTMKPF